MKVASRRSQYQCERRDSNPHGLLHRILSPARLPIPPRSRCFTTTIYSPPLPWQIPLPGHPRIPARNATKEGTRKIKASHRTLHRVHAERFRAGTATRQAKTKRRCSAPSGRMPLTGPWTRRQGAIALAWGARTSQGDHADGDEKCGVNLRLGDAFNGLSPFLLKRSGLNARATQASFAVIPVHFFRRKRVAGTRTGEWATKGEALHYHTGEEAEIEDPK
jgi:hypothetical protein